MSCMVCSHCDALVDTDDDVEGLFEDNAPFRFWCSTCIELADSKPMLAALKAQDPERYAEVMESTDG